MFNKINIINQKEYYYKYSQCVTCFGRLKVRLSELLCTREEKKISLNQIHSAMCTSGCLQPIENTVNYLLII